MSSDKLFMLMRFNVMSFALTDIGQTKISDAYLHAWDNRVYPLSHWAAHWHDGYEDDFAVTKDMIEDISKFLDDKWTKQQPIPSVYDIEDHYGTRMSRTRWDRSSIINALRYFWLDDQFDQAFWSAVMSNVPSEAHGITRKLDRDRDIYFN